MPPTPLPQVLAAVASLAAAGVFVASAAQAEASPDAEEPPEPIAHAVSLGVATDNYRPLSGQLGYRLLPSRTLQLGLELQGGFMDQGFVAGYAVEDGGYGDGRLFVQGTVLREGPLWLDMRLGAGARYQGGLEAPALSVADAGMALDQAWSVVIDGGLIANIEAGPWLTARMGVLAPVVVQVDPSPGLETTGFLTLGGLAFHVHEQLSITADGTVGGVFGWDGDGNKLHVGGQLGLRWLIGGDTDAWRAF